ncbi:MAG: MoaD/ThiS family protein [Desulfobacterales bacterium]
MGEILIRVKLYGTLHKHLPAYDAQNGLSLVLREGDGVHALVARLGLDGVRLGFVSIDGRLVTGDAPLHDGARVRIFQPIFGG